MTKEQEDSIEILENTDISTIELAENTDLYTYSLAVRTVLNMLKEKDAEIEKKDKMIDLMAEEMKKRATCPLDDYNYDLDCENKCNNNTKECWKQYFERKVEYVEN